MEIIIVNPVIDMLGKQFKIGDKVARPVIVGAHTPRIKLCEVTRIEIDGSITLDGSKTAIRFPEHLVIIGD